MPWRVTLTGADTGNEYVFAVDAPANASEHVLYASAAYEYRALVDVGEITEPFRPPMTCTWTEPDKEN